MDPSRAFPPKVMFIYVVGAPEAMFIYATFLPGTAGRHFVFVHFANITQICILSVAAVLGQINKN